MTTIAQTAPGEERAEDRRDVQHELLRDEEAIELESVERRNGDDDCDGADLEHA